MSEDNKERWRHLPSRPIRRRAVLASVVGMVGLAGCSGGGNGGTDDPADDDTTESPDGGTDSPSGDETDDGNGDGGGSGDCPSAGTSGGLQDPGVANGELVRQAIDELEVTAIESSLVENNFGDQVLRVTITFTNNADVAVDPGDYTTDLTVYDDSCNELQMSGVQQGGSAAIEPGETGTIYVQPLSGIDQTKIAGYELTVDCSGPFAEGEFCPESSN